MPSFVLQAVQLLSRPRKPGLPSPLGIGIEIPQVLAGTSVAALVWAHECKVPYPLILVSVTALALDPGSETLCLKDLISFVNIICQPGSAAFLF